MGMASRHRKRQWDETWDQKRLAEKMKNNEKSWPPPSDVLAYEVWNEDVVPIPPPTLARILGIVDIARRAIIEAGSLAERIVNAFDFADGSASVLVFSVFACVALLLTFIGFIWNLLDPDGAITYPLVGFGACVGISFSKP